MRAVVQRVERASVEVEGSVRASIGPGLLVLVGFAPHDGAAEMEYIAQKILDLRVFNDESGVMNLSLADTGGELLLVSQFTLYGDARRGRRPSYSAAMAPSEAAQSYARFVELCASRHGRVKSGVFGADMRVELVNSGPVTILLDSSKAF
jgi:D-tyrosyl-tRNA(Tyr) deacylase